MYRLLIVTDDQHVKDDLAAIADWQFMGFRPPRIEHPSQALECMKQYHFDAVAIDAADEAAGFLRYLDEQHPDLPIFRLESTQEEQRRVLRELCSLLNRIHADDTNDDYDDASRMQAQRELWLKKVIGGMVPTEAEMQRQRSLYRSHVQLDVPCVLARLQLPEDDRFLSERWHYGSERLETALRNFFGREHDHMLLHVAVLSTQEVRVLCYPAGAEEGVSENVAFDYVQETAERIDHYLGLCMKVMDVRRVPGLKAFAAENQAL